MNRPIVDETLCFLCQHPESPVTWEAERNGEKFKLCTECKALTEQENKAQNKIKAAIHQSDRNRIFQYTLGLDPTPIRIEFRRLEEGK